MNDNGNKEPILKKAELETEAEESLSIIVHTVTGKKIDITQLSTNLLDINMEDIAHSLAMQCRYNGHTNKFYSVAEHAVLLSRYALEAHKGQVMQMPIAKVMLLHDASEAYLGDVIAPIKGIMYEYCVFEEYVAEQIYKRFNILQDKNILHGRITELDKSICIDEMQQLMHEVDPELLINPDYKKLGITVQGWTPEQAKAEFLKLAKELNLIGE